MAEKRDFKRVVVISDLHCGHKVGLTHPDFDATYPPGTDNYRKMMIRRKCWKFYAERIEELKPIDALIVNGDAIDGKGTKSGATELLTADRNEQVDMAAEAIKVAGAGTVVMSFGTPYHAGDYEDWEQQIATLVNANKIGSHDWLDVNGCMIGYKHHIGTSSIPHGRFTQLAKQKMWNLFWNEWREYPKSDIIIRSHVHYFGFCGGYGWLGFTTPGLQAYGTKFGTRRCEGTVDFGFLSIDVWDKELFRWQDHIMKFSPMKHTITTV